MAKIKNISGEDRVVPWLGRRVLKGQVVEVPDEDVPAYTCQTTIWAPSDDKAKKLHKTAQEDVVEPLGVAAYEPAPEATEPDNTPEEG